MNDADHINYVFKAQPGEMLIVAEPVQAVDMCRGGAVSYALGDTLRVEFTAGRFIWCTDDFGRGVTFDREEAKGLDRPAPGPSR